MMMAIAILLGACTKHGDGPADTVTVTFALQGVESGTLTRTDYAALLDAAAPSGDVTINLTSTTNAKRTYQVKAGEPVDLVIDTYVARCEYIPTAVGEAFRAHLYAEPRFSAKKEIAVQEGTTAYTLPAQYDCFALIYPTADVAKVTMMDKNVTPFTVTGWTIADGNALLFVDCTSAWSKDFPLPVTLYPTDTENKEATTFTLVTTAADDCLLVEDGKWYNLAPNGVATGSGNAIDIDFPGWGSGN